MNQVQIISLSLAGLVDFSHWSAMNFDLVDFYVYWICRVCCLDSLCFLPNSPLVNFEFLGSTPHRSVMELRWRGGIFQRHQATKLGRWTTFALKRHEISFQLMAYADTFIYIMLYVYYIYNIYI